MMLEHGWVGTSEFREKIIYEGNNKEISNKWADWASDEEFEGFDAVVSTSQIVCKSGKRTTRYQSLHTPTIVVTYCPGPSASRYSCRRAVARSAVYRFGHLFICAVHRMD